MHGYTEERQITLGGGWWDEGLRYSHYSVQASTVWLTPVFPSDLPHPN